MNSQSLISQNPTSEHCFRSSAGRAQSRSAYLNISYKHLLENNCTIGYIQELTSHSTKEINGEESDADTPLAEGQITASQLLDSCEVNNWDEDIAEINLSCVLMKPKILESGRMRICEVLG